MTSQIISDVDDVALVDTTVTYLVWKNGGHVPEIKREPRAKLFVPEGRAAYRPATVVASNVYGDPFVKTGRLGSVVIAPAHGTSWRSPWELTVRIIPPKDRNSIYSNRNFPIDAVLLMWGIQDIALADLPPLTTSIRWHCPSYAAAWQEMSRRCRATGQLWIDTTAAAIAHDNERREQRADRECVS